MSVKIFPRIDEDELEDACFRESVPSKKNGKHTRGIYEAVGTLRATIERGLDCEEAWGRLKSIINVSVADGESSAFGDMAAAWKLEGLASYSLILGGKQVICANWNRQPIRRRTLEVIEAIRYLQDELGRVPTREELRNRLRCTMPNLKAPLTRLGWLKRIPA